MGDISIKVFFKYVFEFFFAFCISNTFNEIFKYYKILLFYDIKKNLVILLQIRLSVIFSTVVKRYYNPIVAKCQTILNASRRPKTSDQITKGVV